jgi:hypothetical protein
MGKVTIKFYLNDKLKSKEENGQTVYQLYVSIIQKRVMSRVKSVLTPYPISKEIFELAEFKEYSLARETEFIKQYFEFADKTINDYRVSTSKTNLGKMLDFWNNDLYLALWDYGFIATETRGEIHTRLATYLAEKSGLSVGATFLLIKDFRENSVIHFLPLVLELKQLRKAGVLTDKQAAKVEFINLLREYTPKGKRKEYNIKIYEFFKDKESILQTIKKRAKFCTPEYITEFAAETENLIKETVRNFYYKFYYTTDSTKANTELELQKAENYLQKLQELINEKELRQ